MLFNPHCVLNQLVKARPILINYQSVRWRLVRKPFWLGIAKSKIFRVPESRVKRTPEEYSEFRRLSNEYEFQMASLLNFIRNDPLNVVENQTDEEKQIEELNREIENSIAKNKEWNAQSAKFREERLKKFKEQKFEEVLKELEAEKEKEKIMQEKIEEIVRFEKMQSKSFITRENLDEAIENCLDHEVEYNFAIDLQGNKYEGKEVFSELLKKTKTKELKQQPD